MLRRRDEPHSRSVLAFSTKGSGSNEEDRIRALVSETDATLLPFDKSRKLRSFLQLIRTLGQSRRRLIVMEGTGLAGGIACMIARLLFGHRYVVSSGDAVGPFIATHVWILGLPFALYERLLCRWCAGFIGWTPYLVGRALTFGAPRGVTAAGWVIGQNIEDRAAARREAREEWGVPQHCIVFGIAGAILWNRRRNYCYGLELVRAIRQIPRDDIAVVIIGDGSGLPKLRDTAGEDLGKRVFLPGRVPLDRVMWSLCGFDVASLPQSTDAVGAFRYTTKISEYRGASLPIVTSRIPAAYDLDLGDCWRLPGENPWDASFIASLAELMNGITQEQLASRGNQRQCVGDTFDRDTQIERVGEFLSDLIDEQTFAYRPMKARTLIQP
jgi:glycosyltransferase involved in cell wall biosynthesis